MKEKTDRKKNEPNLQLLLHTTYYMVNTKYSMHTSTA